ncbi:MAG: MBL fold metallo-hydrolase [Gammaproteobacteria bacterium]|nr:MBL fold metallo-hydrolase [Gammaproteobacteria bacterium]
MPDHNRRSLIRGAFYGALAAVLPPVARAQNSSRLDVTPLGAGTALIRGAGTNVVAAAVADGVVLVDGGRAEHAGALLTAVAAAFDGRPVRTLVNTHWHPEQTGANLAAARAGARIVSQVNTRLWLGTDIRRPWESFVHRPLPSEALPQVTFYDSSRETDLGAPIECGHLLQAHTDGDCYVFFPEANVLACGGVVAGDRWPLIDWWTGGWLGGLVEGIETLLQVADDETRIVPSHGPIMTRAELEAQRDMYAELFVRFRDELLFKGLGPAEAVAARPTADLYPEWQNRDEFVTLAFQGLWGFYAPDV